MAESFQQTVERAFWLRKESDRLDKEATELLDGLGDLQIRNYPAGDFILQVTRTKRFDPVTARKNLTAQEFKQISKMTPNATLAKAVLGEDYNKTQKDYGLTRKIVRVEDLEG